MSVFLEGHILRVPGAALVRDARVDPERRRLHRPTRCVGKDARDGPTDIGGARHRRVCAVLRLDPRHDHRVMVYHLPGLRNLPRCEGVRVCFMPIPLFEKIAERHDYAGSKSSFMPISGSSSPVYALMSLRQQEVLTTY